MTKQFLVFAFLCVLFLAPISQVWAQKSCPESTDVEWTNCVGHYKDESSGIYTGEWLNNEKHGHGTYQFPTGETYIGMWEKGEYQGKGKYIFSNGNIYTGDFKSNNFHGKGKMVYMDGSVEEGVWEEDEFKGSIKTTKSSESNISAKNTTKNHNKKGIDKAIEDFAFRNPYSLHKLRTLAKSYLDLVELLKQNERFKLENFPIITNGYEFKGLALGGFNSLTSEEIFKCLSKQSREQYVYTVAKGVLVVDKDRKSTSKKPIKKIPAAIVLASAQMFACHREWLGGK